VSGRCGANVVTLRSFVLQSYASPFTPGPIPGLDKACCLSVALFTTAKDMARLACVSRPWRKLATDAVGLSCVALYRARLPQQRPGESITRLLRFVETVTVALDVQRISTDLPAVSAGTYHTFVQAASGSLFGFGDAAAGQVAISTF
jgi:hypothetical protein